MFASHGLYCVEIENPTDGFFAQLSGLMPLLLHCRNTNLTPYIIINSALYRSRGKSPNILEYYFNCPELSPFQQKLVRQFSHRKVAHCEQIPVWSRDARISINEGHQLFNHYYEVRQNFLEEVDEFVRTYFSPGATIGLHLRGTDKFTEASHFTLDEVASAVRRVCQERGRITHVFVATDVAGMTERVQQHLPDLRVFERAEYRSTHGWPIHYCRDITPALKGRDAIINCLLLSRCDFLIKTMSNLSAWSKVLNPALPIRLLNRPSGPGIQWLGFPEKEMVEANGFVSGDFSG